MEEQSKQAAKKRKKWKRKAAAAAAGTLAAASMAVGSLFGTADELLSGADDEAQPAQQAVSAQRAEQPAGEQSRPTVTARLRAFLLRQNAFVRALVLLPLWAAGKGLLSLLSLLTSALSPYVGLILGIFLNALLLIGLFLLVYKLLFPDKSLKNLFKKGRWLWFLAGGIALGAADFLLNRYVSDYRALSLFVKLFCGLLALLCLCWRLLEPRLRPAPEHAAA